MQGFAALVRRRSAATWHRSETMTHLSRCFLRAVVLLSCGRSPSGPAIGQVARSHRPGRQRREGAAAHLGRPKNENILWKVPLPGSGGTPARTTSVQPRRPTRPPLSHRFLLAAHRHHEGVSRAPCRLLPHVPTACGCGTQGAAGSVAAQRICGAVTRHRHQLLMAGVYALFGSAVLAGLDLDGKLLWRQEIKPHAYDVALGDSPLALPGTPSCWCATRSRRSRDCWPSTARAVRCAGRERGPAPTGRTARRCWQPSRARRNCWSPAPTAWRDSTNSGHAVVVRGRRCGRYRVAGASVWCRSLRQRPRWSRPRRGPQRQWRRYPHAPQVEGQQVPEGFSSPVIVGSYLYRLHGPGVLRCWRLADGGQVFAERLNGVSTSASPFVTPDGRIYCAVPAGPTSSRRGPGQRFWP